MGDYNLGTASGRIDIDGRPAALGFGVAQTASDAFFKAVQLKVDDVQQLGRRMAAVGAAGVTGFGIAVKAASGFESQMSAVQAVTNATGKDFDALKAKAIELGAKTVYSASDAANAIEELAKAGVPVKDILNGAADATVALAAAGGVSLPNAATIAANAMNQFGLTAKEVSSIADVFAGVANVSAADVGSLGESLSQVGAVAHTSGLSFRDTTIALGELANAGIQGSDAGTSLKTMLLNLIPTTNRQVAEFMRLKLLTFDNATAMKVLKENGIKPLGKDTETLQKQMDHLGAVLSDSKDGSAKAMKESQKLALQTGVLNNKFFDQDGKLKSLEKIQNKVQQALAGMTKEQKLATLQTLFGTDAMRASAILSEQGAEGYRKFSAEVAKTKAADVAKTRLNNLGGAVENLKGSLESVLITIGSTFLPPLTKLINALAKAVSMFNSLPAPIQKVISVIALIASTGLLLVGVLLAALPVIVGFIAHLLLMKVIGSITKGFLEFFKTFRAGEGLFAAIGRGASTTGNLIRTLGSRAIFTGRVFQIAFSVIRGALALITGPVGVVIAIVTALVALGVLLYNKWKPFHDLIDAIGSKLRSALTASIAALQPVIEKTVEGVQKLGDAFNKYVMPALRAAGSAIRGQFFQALQQIASAIKSNIVPAVQELSQTFQEDILPAFNSFKSAIAPLLPIIGKVALVIGGLLVGAIFGLGYVIIRFVLPILIKLAAFFTGYLITAIVGFVVGVVKVITGLIQIFSGLIKVITGIFTGDWGKVWEGAKQIFQGFMNILKGLFTALWGILGGIVTAGWNLLKTIFMAGVNGLLAIPGLLWAGIKALFQAGISFILGLWNTFVTGLKALTANNFALLRQIIATAISAVPILFINLAKNILIGLTNAFFAVTAFLIGVVAGIVGFIRGGLAALPGIAAGIFSAMAGAITGAIGAVVGAVRGGIGAIPGLVRGALSGLAGLARAAVVGMVNAMRSLPGQLLGIITAAWASARGGTSSGINTVVSVVRSLPGKILGILRGLAGQLFSVGVNIIQGLINGIKAMAGRAAAAAGEVVKNAISKAKGLLKLGSPSRLFKQFGVWTMQGLANGFLNQATRVANAATKVVGGMIDAATATVNTMPPSVIQSVLGTSTPAAAAAAAPSPTVVTTPSSSGADLAGLAISGSMQIIDGKAYIQGIVVESIYDDKLTTDTDNRRKAGVGM